MHDELTDTRSARVPLLMPKHCAKIGGLALRANESFEMGTTYSRVHHIAGARPPF